MALSVTLHRSDGQPVTQLPDPSGGTFDAAGDFDSLLDAADLPVLGAVEPHELTVLTSGQMAALISDIDVALSQGLPPTGIRGLRRLRVMAEKCRRDGSLTLSFWGD